MDIDTNGITSPNQNEWIGVYYPTEIISDPRTKIVLCLIFDKVICHFPVTGMVCGGGFGLSEYFADDLLVDYDVLQLREEIMLDQIEPRSTKKSMWGEGKDVEWFRETQITAMALQTCSTSQAVPVTDKVDAALPTQAKDIVDPYRFAKLHAVSLAMQSISMTLPINCNISSEEVLELRSKLKDQLIPFRRSMLKLAPLLRQGITSNASIRDITSEATYIVETLVEPTLRELQERLQKEKGKFWRHVLIKGGMLIPQIALNWMTKDIFSGTISSIDKSKTVIEEILRDKETINLIKSQGELGYLLKLDGILKDNL